MKRKKEEKERVGNGEEGKWKKEERLEKGK